MTPELVAAIAAVLNELPPETRERLFDHAETHRESVPTALAHCIEYALNAEYRQKLEEALNGHAQHGTTATE